MSIVDMKKELAQYIRSADGYWDLDDWRIYSNVSLFESLLDELTRKIDREFGHPTFIAAMGRSGLPLAVSTWFRFSKQSQGGSLLVVSDPDVSPVSQWIVPYKPLVSVTNEKVLLIDADIKTGYTAWDAFDKLHRRNADVVGVASIFDYSNLSKRKMYEQLRKDGIRFVNLFKFKPDVSVKEADLITKTNWLIESEA